MDTPCATRLPWLTTSNVKVVMSPGLIVAGLAEKLRIKSEGAPGKSVGIGIAVGTSVATGTDVGGIAVGGETTVSVNAELLPPCESVTEMIYCPTAKLLGIAARNSVLLTKVTDKLPEPTSATLVVDRNSVPVITRIPLCPLIICLGEVAVTVIGGTSVWAETMPIPNATKIVAMMLNSMIGAPKRRCTTL